MKKKSIQKSIKNLMHLGIDFWQDFKGFWEPEWSHVGTEIIQKSMPIAKNDFLNHVLRKNHYFQSSGGPSWEQKSIKTGGQHGKASWHRFFIDFGGFGSQVGRLKRAKIAQKRHRKNDEKMKRNKMAKKSP